MGAGFAVVWVLSRNTLKQADKQANQVLEVARREAAVAAEIENGDMYDRLIAGTDRADILAVYRNLQAASQERHLPAFRRCVDRGGNATGDATGDWNRPRRRRRRRGGG